MNSELTKEQQKSICSQLGNVRLKLLYKASENGFTGAAFHRCCDNKSPTVSMGYNNSGRVFGGYTRQPFSQSGQWVKDDEAFLFSFSEEKLNTYPVNDASHAVKMSKNSGPNFGGTLILVDNKPKVHSNTGKCTFLFKNYSGFTPEKTYGNDLKLTECEVYQVKECLIFEKPWRAVTWKPEEKTRLLERIKSYKPLNCSVSEARVLLIGPVGAGKSTFFNSFKSVFRSNVSGQAMAGNMYDTSLTEKFRSYTVTDGRGGKPLPLVLCDAMGLEGEDNVGIHIDDISNIINGHILDSYQFNPFAALKPGAQGYRNNPQLKDKIYCVTYVIDASKISIMPQNMERKLKDIHKMVNSSGIPQMMLLTKIDEACSLVKEDVTNVYMSKYIKELMQEASTRVGVPLSYIVPVKNYSEEQELDVNIDILLLRAVDQMLNLVDDFFDEHKG